MNNNITYEVVFKGAFITDNSDEFINKLYKFLIENNVEYTGQAMVFPIQGYTEYEDVTDEDTNNCETEINEAENSQCTDIQS